MKKLLSLVLTAAMLLTAMTVVPASAEDIKPQLPGTPEQSGFVHPGILNSGVDLARIAAEVKSGTEPYASAYAKFKENEFARPGVLARPLETVIRGGNGDNCVCLYQDVQRAFQCAVRWYIEGDSACGNTARDILNQWSATIKSVSGNADRYLASGLYGYQLANASELMRDYPGFELERMQDVLLNVFYKPMCERFLFSNEFGRDHNDAHIQNYWANWDLANMAASTAIGIFCDRRDIYEKAVGYYKNGAGNGSIYNAVPRLYEEGLAQWQESGRDQGHAQLGVGLMASICEMAWNQGEDLYGWANNRFMYAAEYVAKYNNGEDVPFTKYNWRTGQKGLPQSQEVVSNAGRGEVRAIWEMIYNHYHNRKGFELPNVEKRAANQRPEGGPGGHATTFDQPGYGTLLYTRTRDDAGQASDSAVSFKNGTYRFAAKHSGKLLTVEDGLVKQYAGGKENQDFTVTHIGGGEYTITLDGKALGVAGSSYDDGAAIVVQDYTGKINQRFAFIPDGGAYRIIPVHSTKPLDVSGASLDDGAAILQYEKNPGAENQLWTVTQVGEADNTVMTVVVNGRKLVLDSDPIVENGRTLVPMRALFEALNKNVTWNGASKTAVVNDDGKTISFRIDSVEADIAGETKMMDVPARLINNRTMVPLRFISENLGYDVKYDNLNRTAIINEI